MFFPALTRTDQRARTWPFPSRRTSVSFVDRDAVAVRLSFGLGLPSGTRFSPDSETTATFGGVPVPVPPETGGVPAAAPSCRVEVAWSSEGSESPGD